MTVSLEEMVKKHKERSYSEGKAGTGVVVNGLMALIPSIGLAPNSILRRYEASSTFATYMDFRILT